MFQTGFAQAFALSWIGQLTYRSAELRGPWNVTLIMHWWRRMSFGWQNQQAGLQGMFQVSWLWSSHSVLGSEYSTGNQSTATNVDNDREPLSNSSLLFVILRVTEKRGNGSGGYSTNWTHDRDEGVRRVRRTQPVCEGSSARVRNYISNKSATYDRKKQPVPRFSGYASFFDCLLHLDTSGFMAETSQKVHKIRRSNKISQKGNAMCGYFGSITSEFKKM